MCERELRHLTTVCAVLVTLHAQVLLAAGSFELQIKQVQNRNGVLWSGECCGGASTRGRCSLGDQCNTFFRVCLKEYQLRVAATGPCIFGTGATPVLGGNSFSLRHRPHSEHTARILIPFQYAWPRSYSLILEALDYDNSTSGPALEQLIERVTHSGMLNPGEWQPLRHHGRVASVEYKVRVHCGENYFGPFCNKFCRARDDFFGHHVCDAGGNRVCSEGWMGVECRQAICKQGCHPVHGYCKQPGECRCHYGWQGPNCEECVTFPGCVHGSCTEPWKCVCDTNWGGLLCNKDLNYCGTHQPCLNRGTCVNTEPNEYQCICEEGFRGRTCEIVEHACLSSPCANGSTCVEDSSGFQCLCPAGWSGPTCTEDTDECVPSPCAHGGTCQDLHNGFQCSCPPQWTGKTCQLDADECELQLCVNALACRNLIGGYFCDCAPGWSGQNCDMRNDPCPGECQHGGQCEDSPSGHRCHCLPGYTGLYCQTRLGECASAPCLNGGLCTDLEVGFLCHCAMGFTGKHCEVVLDLCSSNPCQQESLCQSTEGGYLCACPEGYEGKDCMSLKDPCHGAHCQGSRGTLYLIIILLSVLAVLVISLCVFLIVRHHRRRKDCQRSPPDESINNQREYINLIRNLPKPEEIELALPPPTSAPLPEKKLLMQCPEVPKVDISNLEREKLNHFHCPDWEELEV